MRWKSLKGHAGLIESLAVQDSGQILASFSRADKEIKLWKVGIDVKHRLVPLDSLKIFSEVVLSCTRPSKSRMRYQME